MIMILVDNNNKNAALKWADEQWHGEREQKYKESVECHTTSLLAKCVWNISFKIIALHGYNEPFYIPRENRYKI